MPAAPFGLRWMTMIIYGVRCAPVRQDTMTDRFLLHLDPRLQGKCSQFIAQCEAAGVDVFLTETYRSEEDQNADYAKGRTTPGPIVTNARYGESPHNCVDVQGNPAARAFDFGIKKNDGTLDWDAGDPAWQAAIEIGATLGLTSGSTFHTLRDSPHFELADWKLVAPWDPAGTDAVV